MITVEVEIREKTDETLRTSARISTGLPLHTTEEMVLANEILITIEKALHDVRAHRESAAMQQTLPLAVMTAVSVKRSKKKH